MNRILFLSCILLFFTLSAYATKEHLLPLPQKSNFDENVSFNIKRDIKLTVPETGENDPAIVEEITSLITSYGGNIVPTSRTKINVIIVPEVSGAEFQSESYSIDVNTSNITIRATTFRGAYWAVQTLWQLSEGNDGKIQGCNITDWAAFSLRGYMHDVGRGFIEFEELKKEIIKLSRYKINTFHWHLTDNQGWRLESKVYPQLNANSSFSRLPGKYYTILQAKELVALANKHGITVIPEIDMPGHSLSFRKAMGHSMLTPQGLEEMKALMTEACKIFSGTEWIHIGTDEVRNDDLGSIDWTVFVPQIVSHIRSCGKKVASWSPGYNYTSSGIDMTQMWSSGGSILPGVPAIDSRYHYANHYDNYADIVSLYNSTIAEQTKGSSQYAGLIVAIWNDRFLPSDEAIIKQNSLYPAILAAAERSWLGGGKGYFPNIGTTLDSNDMGFINWEERFLYHKNNYLKEEPIAYVKQSNVRWKITDAFPNSGNLLQSFPPENGIADSYTYNGKTYHSKSALGAGIYLRHVWGTLIPTFYSNPQPNSTAYAYTYVYSPENKQVGVMLEFQNYGRSEADLAPAQGKWDYKESRIWINDKEILPPVWENTHTTRSNEITLKNENSAARPPINVTLNKGWNKVFMKLPVGQFTVPQVRLLKWMFMCVFTTLDGKNAVDGIIYSP
ncbi:MAG: family 20 glycosylhydrolase, partial [Bacteroidales bacterium]